MAKRFDSLSIADARKLAVAAQGFDTPRPQTKATQRQVDAIIARLGVLQIDSVNVLVRSQELPLFARLGNHNRNAIPKATEAKKIFEYWGHEAAHLPVSLHPLFRWKMNAARTGKVTHWGLTSFYEENKAFVIRTLKHVEKNGPITSRELSTRTEKKGTWWDWDEAKVALEYLFLTGQLMSRGRGSDFARIYDTPERVLPRHILDAPTPSEDNARKQLLVRSAIAQGVATASDLADYYRQKPAAVRPLIAELVEEGELRAVAVDGWTEKAFVHRNAKLSKQLHATALLSPFDSLVWCRPRNERLFNFHYRIEIYTPKEKRKFGYYVLPFMMNGELVGRVDLKGDRGNSTLLVNSVHVEKGVKRSAMSDALNTELHTMANWLGLEQVQIARG
ncbi:MAG: winged helix-turn-helix domain-containing protein [Actinobacteria bacterium]|nr:winged helix-turn-helix domain-containing protein [Actinomycetota bacterium]